MEFSSNLGARASLLLLVSLFSVAMAWDEPSFCNKLDCPQFTVINSTHNYEIRSYKPSVWSSTNVSGIDYDSAVRSGFMKLFDYIQGHNQPNVKVEMAAPVLVDIFPGAGPACNSTFRVNFFMPFADQSNPPAPSDPTVIIRRVPAATFAVTSFGGYMQPFNSTVLPHATALDQALSSAGISHDHMLHTAGYDSPFKIFGRHNEVWLALD
eukprot:CAMPEP_0183365508 /NCGR_PEP_ID=MMETSP0164_2-20130417/85040_1 /TAXON_ID=221442 /ORGANISM="Coccolithus pelagicus ssp braarudi, Strain PLY182g" /LENGTH=209 /DNA_ID=CAMNT_0025541059 /DNA_START=26 /DNA_END=655 /DNA_ORIENTATION=+